MHVLCSSSSTDRTTSWCVLRGGKERRGDMGSGKKVGEQARAFFVFLFFC